MKKFVISIILILIASTYGAFTYDWDETNPTDSTYANLIDDYMRYMMIDMSDRLDSQFYGFIAGENSGYPGIKQLIFKQEADANNWATVNNGEIRIYDANDGNTVNLYAKEQNGYTKTLLRKNGTDLNFIIEANDIPADTINQGHIRLQNNSWLVGLGGDGATEVNLIKVNDANIPIIPNTTRMDSNAAPSASAQVANKQYVDDQVDTQNMTPATYAGEESITFPNGLIFKHGYIVKGSNPTTVTFAAAFPTGVVSAQITGLRNASASDNYSYIRSVSTTALVIEVKTEMTGYYWQVWGY